MIDYKTALENINKRLALPYKGNEQDWDLEFADKSRITEFINVFNTLTDPNERHLLMSLILASYDDYVEECADVEQTLWNTIVSLLNKDRNEYNDVLDNWAIWNERDETDLYNITLNVRAYLTCSRS